MKKIFFSALLLGAALFASAQSKYDHYYTNLPIEIERVQEVKFPSTSVNIAQYGAVPDGKTDCTEAFNKAIKELSKQGGGHVIVPRGVWKTGPIQLRSNIDLHLSKGATILGSENKLLFVQKNDSLRDGSKKCHALIYGSKLENVGITGKGVIDGQGFIWRPIKEKKLKRGGAGEFWDEALALGGTIKPDDKTYSLWYPFNLKPELGIPNIAATAEIQEKMRPVRSSTSYRRVSRTSSSRMSPSIVRGGRRTAMRWTRVTYK